MTQAIESPCFKAVAFFLVFVMSLVGIVPRVEAGLVSSADVYTAMDRAHDLSVVQNKLENKMIIKRLEEFGYSSEEVQARLAQLSDEELHSLATRIGDIDVAGDGLGLVIAILIIVLLVIIILKLYDKSITIS